MVAVDLISLLAATFTSMAAQVVRTSRWSAARRSVVRVQAVAKPSTSSVSVKKDEAQMQVRIVSQRDHVRISAPRTPTATCALCRAATIQ